MDKHVLKTPYGDLPISIINAREIKIRSASHLSMPCFSSDLSFFGKKKHDCMAPPMTLILSAQDIWQPVGRVQFKYIDPQDGRWRSWLSDVEQRWVPDTYVMMLMEYLQKAIPAYLTPSMLLDATIEQAQAHLAALTLPPELALTPDETSAAHELIRRAKQQAAALQLEVRRLTAFTI